MSESRPNLPADSRDAARSESFDPGRLERRLNRWLQAESAGLPRLDAEHALRRVFLGLPSVLPPAGFAERVAMAARAQSVDALSTTTQAARAAIERHWLSAAALLATLWFGALVVGRRFLPEPEVVDGTLFAAGRVGFSFLEVLTVLMQGLDRAASVVLAALSMAASGEVLAMAATLSVMAFSALYVLVRSTEVAS